MSTLAATETALRWHFPYQEPFALAGFAWFALERCYRRLPRNANHPLPPMVDMLANHTAGGQIRVQTDSTRLAIRVRLAGRADMDHMPATGQCGFDLYVGPPGAQRYLATTRADCRRRSKYEFLLLHTPERSLRNFTINFPLYQGVKEVSIGLDDDALLAPPLPYAQPGRIVAYGTSITQGGCASRPGSAYTNILSRRLQREFINLGFSGNGRGEPELAELMAEIADPACYLLDYEANCEDSAHLQRTLPPFIDILRSAHPATPILVLSRIPFANDLLHTDWLQTRVRNRDYQRELVETRRRQGDANIFFADGANLLGEDADECTVDGVHPSDLGFMRMADALEPVLRGIVG